MIQQLMSTPLVRLVASETTWVEGDAVAQLKKTAEREGMVSAVGMPDIHPGKGSPVGGVFLSKALFYPHIIGNDAGCGMGFFKTTLKTRKMKKEKWAAALAEWGGMPEDEKVQYLIDAGVETGPHDAALGTIGGGNHFAELQMVEDVMDDEAFEHLGCDMKTLFLLVHSGSRSLGESLYRDHAGTRGADPLLDGTEEAALFLNRYDHAIRWAAVNRGLIAKQFMDETGGHCEPILDLNHNSISVQDVDGDPHWLHRKGAAPSDVGPVIIPGSRGTFTYLVLPTGPQDQNLWSLAHGAKPQVEPGKLQRKLKEKWTANDLRRTDLGGIVICDDRDLIYEEAPQAFKKIDTVINAMVDCGLIRVIATFRPVITLKAG